jgi:carbon-monoxide dehydrogenase medium subunit
MVKFDYHPARTVAEAVEILSHYGEDSRPLAGGTALLIDIKNNSINPAHLVSLVDIDDLDQIHSDGSGWRIGALTRLSAVEDKPDWHFGPLQAMVDATHVLGGRQIRNIGTIGGNLCYASPCADMAPPLLCLDAELLVANASGMHTLPLDGFFVGPKHTVLLPAELLTEILLPPIPLHTGSAFTKMMRRRAVDLSTVGVAARISLSENLTCIQARIAINSAAPIPFRAKQAEQLLEGNLFSQELIAEAAQQAMLAAQPIDDVRASANYRRQLVHSLTIRAVQLAWERAGAVH